jgi:hypothetical protein
MRYALREAAGCVALALTVGALFAIAAAITLYEQYDRPLWDRPRRGRPVWYC